MPDITTVLSEDTDYKGAEWSLNGSPTSKAEFDVSFTMHKLNGKKNPVWADLQKKLKVIQAEYDALEYQRTRKPLYPTIEDVTVALAEKAEGDSTMWDAISKQRADVKKAHPKP
jgi:hypothetical protein